MRHALRPRHIGWLATVVAIALVAACSTSTSGKTIDVTAADSGSTIQASVGDTIVITLDANPTTGYSWELAPSLDPEVVEFVSDYYEQAPASPAMVGVGGTDTWTFKAVGEGQTTIELGYVPPGGSTPDQSFTVTVDVGG